MIVTILATLVVLGVLIFVHELGHFITAKAVGIEVPRFSIGLGPKLIGFRRGETEYVVSWLPLGGYVRMAGMEELEPIEGGKLEREEKTGLGAPSDVGLTAEAREGARASRTFDSKSLPARALVISAGVLMNALFAFVVFAGIAWLWGVDLPPGNEIAYVDEMLLPPGASGLAAVPTGVRLTAIGDQSIDDWEDVRTALATVPAGPTVFRFEGAPAVSVEVPADDPARAALYAALQPIVPPVLGEIQQGSPAEAAGLLPGDTVLSVAGQPVRTWQDVVLTIQENPEQPIEIVLQRAGRTERITVVPARETVVNAEGGEEVIGRIGAARERYQPGPVASLGYGAQRTWDTAAMIVGFLGDLVTGRVSPRNLGGPILIGQLSGQVARLGIQQFLNFMALFSINLAVLNLLPIPILDGGQLLFLGIEAVRGRALSLEARMRLTQVGLVIIVALMVWAFASDILRIVGL